MISQSLSSLPSFGTKKWFKRYAIIFTILLAVLSSVVLVLNVGQVQPYEALWDSSIKEFKYWNRKIYPWGVVVLQCKLITTTPSGTADVISNRTSRVRHLGHHIGAFPRVDPLET